MVPAADCRPSKGEFHLRTMVTRTTHKYTPSKSQYVNNITSLSHHYYSLLTTHYSSSQSQSLTMTAEDRWLLLFWTMLMSFHVECIPSTFLGFQLPFPNLLEVPVLLQPQRFCSLARTCDNADFRMDARLDSARCTFIMGVKSMWALCKAVESLTCKQFFESALQRSTNLVRCSCSHRFH